MKYVFYFMGFLTMGINLPAQNIVYPNQFKCGSSLGPVMNYFKDAAIVQEYTQVMDSLLLDKKGLHFPPNTLLQFQSIMLDGNENNEVSTPQINFSVVEYAVKDYCKIVSLQPTDSSLIGIQSVFILHYAISQHRRKIVQQNDLIVLIKSLPTKGIGLPAENLHLTNNGFLSLLKKSTAILLDSTNQYEQITVNVQEPFIGDNFILNTSSGYTRNKVNFSNNIARFLLNNKEQIIRWGEPMFQNIILRGKNKTNLSIAAIDNFNKLQLNTMGEPILLLQDARDVINNKSYQINMLAQNVKVSNEEETNTFTNLLPGKFHTLILDKDTIAHFSVDNKSTIDSSKKFNYQEISNGIDTGSVYMISKTPIDELLIHDCIMEGTILTLPFKIEISANKYIRSFYLNNKLLAIVTGKNAPEIFVNFDAAISAEIFNALLLVGYSSLL